MELKRDNWYHGTLFGELKSFYPFSHFGTKLCALEACAYKYFHTKDKTGFQPTLIEVELDFRDDDVFHYSKDWGSPNPVNLCATVAKISDKMEAVFKPMHSAFLSRINRNEDRYNVHEDATRQLLTELERFNCRLISYPNNVEGIKGEASVCVMDSRIIRIKSYRAIAPIELVKVFLNHPPAWHVPGLCNEEYLRIEQEIANRLREHDSGKAKNAEDVKTTNVIAGIRQLLLRLFAAFKMSRN